MTNAAGRLADQGFGSSIEVARMMKVACLDTSLVWATPRSGSECSLPDSTPRLSGRLAKSISLQGLILAPVEGLSSSQPPDLIRFHRACTRIDRSPGQVLRHFIRQ